MEPDLTSYLEGWKQAWADDAIADREHAARARALLPGLVAILRPFGARRVVLIGSLASGGFKQGSDIDLVVYGVSPARFFEACADVDRYAGDIPVDVVPFESARPFVKEMLEGGEGEVIYDAAGG